MKTLVLPCAVLAILAIAGCDDDRPAPTHAETRDSHMKASGEAEKSFDKENPANPGQFAEEPKK